MEDVKEYLHLYKGCEIKIEYDEDHYAIGVIAGYTESEAEPGKFIVITEAFTEHYAEDVKLIVRRLDSMTEEEAKEFFNLHKTAIVYNIKPYKINGVTVEYKWIHDDPTVRTEDGYCYSEVGASIEGSFTFDKMQWLLSKGFWLFDPSAFDKGLIIDSKTLNKEV